MSIYHVARTLKGSPCNSRRDGVVVNTSLHVSWSAASEFGSAERLMAQDSQRLLAWDETMANECLSFCQLTLDFSKLILHSRREITIGKNREILHHLPSVSYNNIQLATPLTQSVSGCSEKPVSSPRPDKCQICNYNSGGASLLVHCAATSVHDRCHDHCHKHFGLLPYDFIFAIISLCSASHKNKAASSRPKNGPESQTSRQFSQQFKRKEEAIRSSIEWLRQSDKRNFIESIINTPIGCVARWCCDGKMR